MAAEGLVRQEAGQARLRWSGLHARHDLVHVGGIDAEVVPAEAQWCEHLLGQVLTHPLAGRALHEQALDQSAGQRVVDAKAAGRPARHQICESGHGQVLVEDGRGSAVRCGDERDARRM
ncbi:hypothetical protein ACWZHB_09415 [Nocardia sp. FBN12]|uniref:hypothetical protein n=1 Tax=Nocardia sp. FBN12 TaxID=3419766 RepID=UPI003D092B95